MDTQSESCEPPPCDPQPGKIRKAFKLFSKRKPGSSVASIFSMRGGKSEGGPKSPPSRSQTLDGLNETAAPEAEAETVDLDQEDSQKEDAPKEESNLGSTPTRQSISSITSAKSLSFLNMLRRTRKGGGGERLAQTESQRPGRQRKGLKGLFGSVRWHGKEKEEGEEVAGPPLLASRSNSVEIIKENLTLTPRPPPRSPDGSEAEQQPSKSQDEPTSSEDTSLKVSESAKPPTNDRLSTLLGDISSILSFDTLTSGGDIVADVEAEWVKVSTRVEETDDVSKKDKTSSAAVSAKLKPILSPTSPLSATSSTKPSPTSATKPLSTFTPSPKPTTKPTPSPSPSISTKPPPSPVTAPVPSPKLDPPSSPTPAPSPIPSAKPASPLITKPTQSPPTPPTSVLAEPVFVPTSTFEPPATPSPAPSPAPVPEPSSSPTAQSPPELSAPPALRMEPTPTPPAATKPTPTPAPTSTTKPSHSSASAPKYPPFSTSTKPTPTAPVTRPKIVTTFGLSTSRNTAPIAKPETKPTKSSPPLSQSGSVSSITRAASSEYGPPSTAKTPPATSPPPFFPPVAKPQHTTEPTPPQSSSATSAKPTYKREPADTSLLSGSPPVPVLTSSPRPASLSAGPRGEKEQEDVVKRRGLDAVGEKRSSAVKPTALSKIPVSGGGRPKQHHRESNGDEGHWNLPTPANEEESPVPLERESSSKEALSDFATGSGAVTPTTPHSHEDILDSAARHTAGATSLESRIPMKAGSTATYHSLQGKTNTARSKIPVSKVPVRRTSNKPAPTATAAATRK